MDSDRIKVLHAANSDAVVIAVADDLELDFLPSGNTALDEHLPDHRVSESLDDRCDELLLVLGDATACTAHCIRGANNDRISNVVSKRNRCMDILNDRTLRNRFTELFHRFLEAFAILRFLDGIQ